MTTQIYDFQKDCGSSVSCPILYALNLINQKWKVPILWHLSRNGSMRYGELQRKLFGISGTMLSKDLKELVECGILQRAVKKASIEEVSYSFTESGAELIPVLNQLFDWGTSKMLEDGYPEEAILRR